jgi:hypothetical protein
LVVEFEKELIGGRNQIVVGREVVRRSRSAVQEFSQDLRPILIRKRVEFLEQQPASCLQIRIWHPWRQVATLFRV